MHNQYSSPIIWMTKSRRMIRLRHWHVSGFWWGHMKERYHLEKSRYRWEDNIKTDLTKQIVKKQDGREGVGFIRLRIQTDGGLL